MSVVIYGGGGWIGQQVQVKVERPLNVHTILYTSLTQELLKQRSVPFHVAKCRVGRDDESKAG
jgi:hypothetical protein